MGSPELKDSCIQAENCYKSACLNEGRGEGGSQKGGCSFIACVVFSMSYMPF